jgi:hypothetical protein
MSKQWTDADVARMLGWYFEPDGRYRPAKYGQLNLEFGLSTPPSAEADANAARYVLPWFITTFPDTSLLIEMRKNITTAIGKSEKIFIYLKPSFSEALCTAALEAYHEKGNDDAK